MDERAFERVKGLFNEVLEAGPGKRDRLLGAVPTEIRQEVEALLDAHERAKASDDPSLESLEISGGGPGTTIGRYKLLHEIGEGGFGVVYMAEQQEPVRRKVALKIIKLGMDTKQVIARFEAERQALALMDHPNIAKVFDAGATNTGRPYFVMELVKGIPVTEYCDQASLKTEERLSLFAAVCRAIQHAHQKGIIHRDLKPGNVLVTLHDGKPVPKVIDFGIAKATDRRLTEKTLFTEFRQMIGTPDYMAPEQAELSSLDIDTRADVYSLGVLLYELLTGSKPFELRTLMEKGWNEILRHIREVDPPKPSTKLSTMGEEVSAVAKNRHTQPKLLGKVIRGDLDWIVMKALEKDRSRRYDSADAMALDVMRYLEDQPVLATPPSTLYRVRKYLKRHKVGVAASAAVLLALMAGLVAALLSLLEARSQENAARAAQARTEKEVERSATTLDLLNDMLVKANPYEAGNPNYKVRDLLDDFAAGLTERVKGQPLVEASIRDTIGCAYFSLDQMEKAEKHIERALEIYRSHEDEELALASTLLNWCWVLNARGRNQAALDAARGALSIRRRLLGEDDLLTAAAHRWVADSLTVVARYEEAEEHARRALAVYLRVQHDSDVDESTACRLVLSRVLVQRGKYAEAEALLRESRSLVASERGGRQRLTTLVELPLARLLSERGDFGEAEALIRGALDREHRITGEKSARTASCLLALGEVATARGAFPEGVRLMEEALELSRAILGVRSLPVAGALMQLGVAHRVAGAYDAAVQCFRESLDINREVNGEKHPVTLDAMSALGHALTCRGDWAEGGRLLRRAREFASETLPEAHPRTIAFLANLTGFLSVRGEFDEAEKLSKEALLLTRQVFGEGHPRVAASLIGLSMVLVAQARDQEAEKHRRRAVEILREAVGERHPQVVDALYRLSDCLTALERFDDAEETAKEAIQLARDIPVGGEYYLCGALAALGGTLTGQGRYREAEACHREALALTEKLQGEHSINCEILLGHLANALQKQGNWKEAADLHRRALANHERAFGEDHAGAGMLLSNLGLALSRLGRHDEAVPMLRKAVRLNRDLYGHSHPFYACSLGNLGGALEPLGDLEEVEKVRREAVAAHRRAHPDGHRQLASALSNLGGFLTQIGRSEEALSLHEEAHTIHERSGAGERPGAVRNLSGLGTALQALGRPEEAESALRRAVKIAEVHGFAHLLATAENNLATQLLETKRVGEAASIQESAVRHYREFCPDGDATLARMLWNLSVARMRLGNQESAAALGREALDMAARHGGFPPVQLAGHRHELAHLLRRLGRNEASNEAHVQAVVAYTKALGPDHPDTVNTRSCAAGCAAMDLSQQGRDEEAMRLMEETLAIQKRLAPEAESAPGARLRWLLAMGLIQRGEADRVEKLLREGLAILARVDDLTLRAFLQRELGMLLTTKGEWVEAVGLLEAARPKLRENFDGRQLQMSAPLISALSCLANCLWRLERYGDAEPVFRKHLEALRKTRPPSPRGVANALRWLSACVTKLEKHTDAERLLRELLDLAREANPDGGLEVAQAEISLANTLNKLGRYADAEPLLRSGLSVREKEIPGDWRVYSAMSLLGESLAGQGKYAEAEPLLVEGYERMAPPENSALRKAKALDRLVSFYEAQGKLKEAAELRARGKSSR